MRRIEKTVEVQAAEAYGEAGRVSGGTATTNKLHTFDTRDTSPVGGTKRKNYKRKTIRRRRRR